jgi:predicted RND superfamily exporter protein
MSSIRPITLHDIPQSLRERHTDADGRYLLRVFARQPLWESHHLEQFIHAVSSVAPEATGKPYTTWEGLIGMQWGFIRAGLLALAAIVIILLFDLQHLTDVLLALIPLTVGVATSLGAFGWLGWPLNPANMIALPLIVGVGVDNGVHVIHDWRARRAIGGTYQIDAGTSRGILVAGLTTIIGFGALMISHHRGLAGLGAILALGVSGSLITALTLLPQILNTMAAMSRSTKQTIQTTDPENETARANWARAA